MALITSGCDAMRLHGHQMALITSARADSDVTVLLGSRLGGSPVEISRNQRDDATAV